jgi:hypothetical protein
MGPNSIDLMEVTPARILYDVKTGNEVGLSYHVCGLKMLGPEAKFVYFVLGTTRVLPRAKYRSGKGLRVVSNDSALLHPPPSLKIKH